MSLGGGESKSESKQESRPSTPQELADYFNTLNSMTSGRLNTLATQGTTPSYYDPLTQEELQAIGGAGATRQVALDTSYADQTDQIASDSSMTYAQKTQANQQAAEAYNQQSDAINKEVEAAMTGLASQEQMRLYQAELANNQQLAKDLALLSQIFYGGKGQYSTSTSESEGWNANLGLW